MKTKCIIIATIALLLGFAANTQAQKTTIATLTTIVPDGTVSIKVVFSGGGDGRIYYIADKTKWITSNPSFSSTVHAVNGVVTLWVEGALPNITLFECDQQKTLTGINMHGTTAMGGTLQLTNNTNLTTVNVAGCTQLQSLICRNVPNLATLDVTGCTQLQKLHCYNNGNNSKLTSLDASSCIALTELVCLQNNLTQLLLNPNAKLEALSCEENKLTTLNIPGNTLTYLNCNDNLLTAINVSGAKLTLFRCYNNRLPLSRLYSVASQAENNAAKRLGKQQPVFFENASIGSGTTLNLGTERTFDNVKTVFTVKRNGANAANTDYAVNEGNESLITFYNPGTYTVEMTNAAFYSNNTHPTIAITGDILVSHTSNYHTVDKGILRAFLRQPSSEAGKRNLQQFGLTPADTIYWIDSEGWIDKLTDITWDVQSPRRINAINFNNLKLAGSLDVSGLTSLTTLHCNNNSLSSLNVSGLTSLTTLFCISNALTSLNVSGCTGLKDMNLYNNALTSLNVSGLTSLEVFNCNNNSLTSLDVSGLTNLTTLNCHDNRVLTSLNVSGLTKLTTLYCGNNKLTSLNVSGLTSLEMLDCSVNSLTSLDVSALTKLTTLFCYNNHLPLSQLYAIGKRIADSNNKHLGEQRSVHFESKAMNAGEILDLSAERIFDNINTVYSLKKGSNNTNAISGTDYTINDGKITFLLSETYRISMTNSAITSSAIHPVLVRTGDITVTGAAVTGVSLNKSATTINAGSDETLTATVAPDNATNKAVTWSSSDNTVAIVDVNGKVTGIKAGTAGITVTTVDGSHTATCTVTVQAVNTTDYHAGDKGAIRAFLRQPSADAGQRNLHKAGLTPADTVNWIAGESWIAKISNITWNDQTPKRITVISIENLNLGGSLDVSGCTGLEVLDCSFNSLTSLNASGLTGLEVLDCFNNSLTSLNVSGLTSLARLDCFNNSLTSLNVSGLTSLIWLSCFDNKLTSLNVSGLTNLTGLSCFDNKLTSLNVSGLTKLEMLECFGNSLLTSLDVSGLTSLKLLDCNNNSLISLNVSGLTRLETLNCAYNSLTSLNVSGLTRLETLICQNNRLPLSQLYTAGKQVDGKIFDIQQPVLFENKAMTTGEILDLSAERTFDNVNTVYTVKKSSNNAIAGTDYTINDGKIAFLLAGTYTVEMTNTAIVSSDIEVTSSNIPPTVITKSASPAIAITGAITVTAATIETATGVSLNKTATTISVGGDETLTATVAPANATNKAVTWSSSDNTVATVDATGKVTGIKAGTAGITVTTVDGSHTATCTVTVQAGTIAVSGISLNKTATTVSVGGDETLMATVAPANATNKAVTWRSSDNAVATVDANGKVTGIKAGTAIITVTTLDSNHTATCTVTVTSDDVSNGIVDDVSLKAYPNPTEGLVTVTGLTPGATIRVYSNFGLLVASHTATDAKMTIDFGSFAPGMYYINVNGKTLKVIRK